MGPLQRFFDNLNWQGLDWQGLLLTVLSAVAALVCLTVHELCHGLMACRLGDPTAKNAGRLTLNPIRHLDPLGFLLLVTAGVGWAKPVPVDMRYFQKPKRDMALTALAGPASNFVLAWLFLLPASLLWHLGGSFSSQWAYSLWLYTLLFFMQAALLSVGLGVFNLIPIPPLDGSKILFSLLPDRIYYTILRYERYIMLALLAVVWLGVFDGPLSAATSSVIRLFCRLSGFPWQLFSYFFYL